MTHADLARKCVDERNGTTPSLRFSLVLLAKDEDAFNEFSYVQLLQKEPVDFIHGNFYIDTGNHDLRFTRKRFSSDEKAPLAEKKHKDESQEYKVMTDTVQLKGFPCAQSLRRDADMGLLPGDCETDLIGLEQNIPENATTSGRFITAGEILQSGTNDGARQCSPGSCPEPSALFHDRSSRASGDGMAHELSGKMEIPEGSTCLPDVTKPLPSELNANGDSGNLLAAVPVGLALPGNLSPQLLQAINGVRQAVALSKELSVEKCLRLRFTQEINRLLIEVENLMSSVSLSCRTTIFGCLADILSCDRESLSKHAKKLQLAQNVDVLKDPIGRLKEEIQSVMPSLIEKHQAEVSATELLQQQQQQLEMMKDHARTATADDDDEDGEQENVRRLVRFPRKKFKWNTAIRLHLCEVVRLKMEQFRASKTRSQSAEDYLKAFLDAEIKPLWPRGWIQTRMLFKESRASHHEWTTSIPKLKKFRLVSSKVPRNSSGTTTTQHRISSDATVDGCFPAISFYQFCSSRTTTDIDKQLKVSSDARGQSRMDSPETGFNFSEQVLKDVERAEEAAKSEPGSASAQTVAKKYWLLERAAAEERQVGESGSNLSFQVTSSKADVKPSSVVQSCNRPPSCVVPPARSAMTASAVMLEEEGKEGNTSVPPRSSASHNFDLLRSVLEFCRIPTSRVGSGRGGEGGELGGEKTEGGSSGIQSTPTGSKEPSNFPLSRSTSLPGTEDEPSKPALSQPTFTPSLSLSSMSNASPNSNIFVFPPLLSMMMWSRLPRTSPSTPPTLGAYLFRSSLGRQSFLAEGYLKSDASPDLPGGVLPLALCASARASIELPKEFGTQPDFSRLDTIS